MTWDTACGMDMYRSLWPCALLRIDLYDSSTWTPGWPGGATTYRGKILLALFLDTDVQQDEGVQREVRMLAPAVVEAVWLTHVGEGDERDGQAEVVQLATDGTRRPP